MSVIPKWGKVRQMSAAYAVFFALTGFVILNGFSCGGKENNTPDGAATGAQGFNVSLGFGPDPDFDDDFDGHGDVHDLCQYFTVQGYKIRKIIVEVFRHDANNNQVNIYPPVEMKEGVNFLNGNPRSTIGQGLKFKIPETGAFKIRVRVWGYDCDDLPQPEDCLDCCEDDWAGPYWEQESSWTENKKYGWAYISYPKFLTCS